MMRTAAAALGITGGVLGIFAALLALAIGGVASAVHSNGGGEIVALGYAAFFVSIAGIVGGALAPKKPIAAGALLVLTGIAGFICISGFWLLSGPLLIVGSIFAFFGHERAEIATPAMPLSQPLTPSSWTPSSQMSAPLPPSRYEPQGTALQPRYVPSMSSGYGQPLASEPRRKSVSRPAWIGLSLGGLLVVVLVFIGTKATTGGGATATPILQPTAVANVPVINTVATATRAAELSQLAILVPAATRAAQLPLQALPLSSPTPLAAQQVASAPIIASPTSVPKPSPTTIPPTAAPAPAATPVPAVAVNNPKVGQRIMNGPMAITVNEVRDPSQDPILPPKAGNRYIALDVTIENISSKTFSPNPFNTSLKTADDRAYTPAFGGAPDPGLSSNDLQPGEKVRGWIAFEVSQNATTATFRYQDFGGTTITIALH